MVNKSDISSSPPLGGESRRAAHVIKANQKDARARARLMKLNTMLDNPSPFVPLPLGEGIGGRIVGAI
jgi:hypothetical protein